MEMEQVNAEAHDFELAQQIRGIPPMITVSAMALVIGRLLASEADDEAQLQRGVTYLISVISMTAVNHLTSKIRH